MTDRDQRILFVDDDERLLRSIKRVLIAKQVGWQREFFSSPHDACSHLRSNGADVIVTDLRMPLMDGLSLVEEIRQFSPEETKYILLTGNGDLAAAIRGINESRIDLFLTKPCEIDDLVEAVNSMLLEQKKERENRATGDAMHQTLSTLSSSILIVQNDRQIVYANESARALCKKQTGLILDPKGHLRATQQNDQEVLSLAISRAIEATDTEPQFLSISSSKRTDELKVLITRIADNRVAILITEPGNTPIPSPESLVEMFNLNRAESIIAYTITSGGTLEDACVAGGITLGSARTYLKRIFQKTGVSRQSDLVQLISSTPASIYRTSSKTISKP